MRDTIFAPATAPGRAAVAVVRVSGPDAAEVVTRLAGGLPAARRASYRTLRSAAGEVIDRALVLWFPGPVSYTGEDCAEFQVHGGPAVVAALVASLAGAGLRLAEPGEFTRRAFEGGKLDLDQAEAVADLVDAETQAQARQALGQLEGALGRRYEGWRRALVEALAFLEAAVDFPDENLPAEVARRAAGPLGRLIEELTEALADAGRGRRVREGYRIAIIGAPNAGKSSLLNGLAERDAAIVTATPGTTRDVIEVPLLVEGFKVLLADTAGVRPTIDLIEAEGVRRARAWAEAADLRLWVVDGSVEGSWREAEALVRSGDFCLLNKVDLPVGADRIEALASAEARGQVAIEVSATAQDGLELLRSALAARVSADLAGADFPAVTRERHGRLLGDALAHLRRGAGNLEAPELAAEDLRLAARSLGRVAGRIGAEDVLDQIFASFCIGK